MLCFWCGQRLQRRRTPRLMLLVTVTLMPISNSYLKQQKWKNPVDLGEIGRRE